MELEQDRDIRICHRKERSVLCSEYFVLVFYMYFCIRSWDKIKCISYGGSCSKCLENSDIYWDHLAQHFSRIHLSTKVFLSKGIS